MRVLSLFLVFAFVFSFREKIEPEVLNKIETEGGKVDIFVDMHDTVDFEKLKPTLKSLDHIQKGRLIVDLLQTTADRSQFEIRKLLKKDLISFENLWIQNSILIKGARIETIEKLAKRIEVKSIRWDRIVHQELEQPHPFSTTSNTTQPEWNIMWVKADKLWEKNIRGRGITLAVADTGVQFQHEALIASYKGNTNGTFNHNYHWYDPHGNSVLPVDDNGHGTHVMATTAGGLEGRKVGMAPAAKWIACRAFSGSGSASNFVKCNQFFLAPHDMRGQNPNPDLRPHATSHSYVCGGCGLRPSIQALYAAGVFFIKSCGNSGSRCRSITEPGNYPEVFCIAALTKNSNVAATFSSRGPATDGHQKPTFSAPGSLVNSAYIGRTNNIYRELSGTSMAAPCFNGAVGLLWSAVPELIRDLEGTIEVFKKSALGQESSDCTSSGTPNYVYGFGTINVEKAVEIARKIYQSK